MSRRAQEEAVGFVAIIVIVAIATVFFIGISIRNEPSESARSLEIKQFLETADKYTTDCSISYADKYMSMGDLARSCYQGPSTACYDGRNACQVYNTTMEDMIEKSFAIGDGYAIKGYAFNMTYSAQGRQEEVLKIGSGSCLGSYREEELIKPDTAGRGSFVSTLRLCS